MSQQADQIRRSRRVQNLSPLSFPPHPSSNSSLSQNSPCFEESQTTVGSTQSHPASRAPTFTPHSRRPASAQASFSVPQVPFLPPPPTTSYPQIPHSLPSPHPFASSAPLPPSITSSCSPDNISETSSIPSFPIPNLSFNTPSPFLQPSHPSVSPRTASSFHFPQEYSSFGRYDRIIMNRGIFAGTRGLVMGEDPLSVHLLLDNQVVIKTSKTMLSRISTTPPSDHVEVLYQPPINNNTPNQTQSSTVFTSNIFHPINSNSSTTQISANQTQTHVLDVTSNSTSSISSDKTPVINPAHRIHTVPPVTQSTPMQQTSAPPSILSDLKLKLNSMQSSLETIAKENKDLAYQNKLLMQHFTALQISCPTGEAWFRALRPAQPVR